MILVYKIDVYFIYTGYSFGLIFFLSFQLLVLLFSDNNIQLPWLVDGDEFHAMLSRGEFQSYEHRFSLGSRLIIIIQNIITFK